MTKEPVLTDKTGLVIAQKLGEVAQSIRALYDANNPNYFEISAGMAVAADSNGNVAFRAVLGSNGSEIYKAYTEGRPLILSIFNNSMRVDGNEFTAPKQFRIGLTEVIDMSIISKLTFHFDSADGNNPYDASYRFAVTCSTSSADATIGAMPL